MKKLLVVLLSTCLVSSVYAQACLTCIGIARPHRYAVAAKHVHDHKSQHQKTTRFEKDKN